MHCASCCTLWVAHSPVPGPRNVSAGPQVERVKTNVQSNLVIRIDFQELRFKKENSATCCFPG